MQRFLVTAFTPLLLLIATTTNNAWAADSASAPTAASIEADHNTRAAQPGVVDDSDHRSFARGFFEMGLGVRSLSLSGMTLKNHGALDGNTNLVVSGDSLTTGYAGAMNLGGGLALGPIFLGAEIGVGIGGNTRGATQRAGDIDVRPSGFNALMTTSTFVGFMYETNRIRYRLDGVLGYELDGIGMERPGFRDTAVSAVNAERWTLGPRFRVDFYRDEFAHVGVALGCNARDAKNVTFGVVASF